MHYLTILLLREVEKLKILRICGRGKMSVHTVIADFISAVLISTDLECNMKRAPCSRAWYVHREMSGFCLFFLCLKLHLGIG